MERRLAERSFVDEMTCDLGGRRTTAFFEKCNRLIPWSQLAQSLGRLYEDGGGGGRPAWPVVLMIKSLLVQKWFNLSDPQLEEMLSDRLSFRRFVGLSLEDGVPDETTFVRFRQRLRELGQERTLFETTARYLERQGVLLKNGTLVDATLLEAPRGREREDGSSTRDAEAEYTSRPSKAVHGYKAHVATDRRGLIRDYRVTHAAVHDSVMLEELTADEHEAVYADSGYMSAARSVKLRRRGIQDGIMRRRVRGQASLSKKERRRNQAISKIRGIVELAFAWMKNTGFRRVRYRGQDRNDQDVGVWACAYNWKRSLSLLSGA